MIKNAGAGIAHCPKSNAKLSHGRAPFAEFLAQGLNVGLGSDSVASNNVCDILEEARFATLLARVSGTDFSLCRSSENPQTEVCATDALFAATLGGARALGLDDRIGSLEEGKDADLAAFRIDIARTTPLGDPYSAAVFALPGRSADLVAVRGEVLVEGGRCKRPDPTLIDRVQAAGAALAKWADTQRPQ
jgi:5-methylthioadenosine/S-adenosylhomocysteine deaminase